MILPYIEQQNLYNTSNVIGYPGWAGPYATPKATTATNANLYNMDWANSTLRRPGWPSSSARRDAEQPAGQLLLHGARR